MSFLTKKIINFEERYLSVDFSDLSLKLLQLEKTSGEDRVRSYFAVGLSSDCLSDGRITDKSKTAKLILAALSQAGPKKINTKKVICSLPESKIFLRIISIPRMEKKEIAEAIKWEIEASIPLSIDQIYYDWQLLGEKDGKQNILTVAVAREIADEILEILELANLKVCLLESESLALARSLIGKAKAKVDEAVLIVDLGAKMTNFIVAQNGVPFFTSSIPFSSDGVTDAIAKSLGVDNEEAQKIKFSRGLGKISEESSIFNSMQAYLESLTAEIEKSIDFYQSLGGKESVKIKKILICGGGANLKGLLTYLIKRLGREVSFGDPWINLNFGQRLPSISKERAIQFTTAIGLALRGSGEGINLLPPNKKQALVEHKKFKTILGWELIIVIIACCFFAFLFGIDRFLSLDLEAISLAKNGQADNARYAKIEDYQSQFSQINARLTKLALIDADQLYWSPIFLQLNSATPEAVEITELETKDLTLSLTGHANTRDDLLAFKENLGKIACFLEVNLPVSNLVSKENIDFSLDLKIDAKCLKK